MMFRDLMPWGRRARGEESAAGTLDSMRTLVESMGRAFEEPWEVTSARLLGGEWTPRVDVRESEKDVYVKLTLPDMKKEDLHLSATEDTLTIRGVKKSAQKSEGKTTETVQSFYRSLTLPATIRPDDVKAVYKDGEMSITLPKAKHSKVKRVSIS
jgi:HSP20 family protein